MIKLDVPLQLANPCKIEIIVDNFIELESYLKNSYDE